LFDGATARLATLRPALLFSRDWEDRPVKSVVEVMLLISQRNAFLLLHLQARGVKLIIWNRSNHEFLKPVTA